MGLGEKMTPDKLAKMGLSNEEAWEGAESAIESWDKSDEQISAEQRAAQLEKVREERTRMETAGAIENKFGEVFLQSLVNIKMQPENQGLSEAKQYEKAMEIAYAAAYAEAKQRDPNLRDELIAELIMTTYASTLEDLGKRKPGHDYSAEDMAAMQRIIKTEKFGMSMETQPPAQGEEEIPKIEFGSAGGASTASFEEAEKKEAEGPDRSDEGPAMFKLSDMK